MKPRSGNSKQNRAAFTLLDLVALVAILLLLAMTALPGLARVRANPRAGSCLNNLRRLTGAWQMYTADNADTTPFKLVAGAMDWSPSPDTTNAAILMDPTQSAIARYVQSSDLFKCPADSYQSAANLGPRVRSVSANALLGGGSAVILNEIPGRTYFVAKKLAQLNKPGPANTFVVLDEHPDGIDDALFQFYAGAAIANAYWRSFPAGYHSNGAGISFADGRAAIQRWQDPRVLRPVVYAAISPLPLPIPGCPDYVWFNEHVPYR
jgi:prepilin-type processing-associated H-X9-DG protein